MIRMMLPVSVALVAFGLIAQGQPRFEESFENAALRIDFFHTGDAREELITIDRLTREPLWPESTIHLLDPFNYGRYAVVVYDSGSGTMLYSRGFDCMYGEYRTTSPALNGVKRTFNRSVRIPFPRHPIRVVFQFRDRSHVLHPLCEIPVNPSDFHIHLDALVPMDIVSILKPGTRPATDVDIVFLSEGYMAGDSAKFRQDATAFTDYLFTVEPYRSLKEHFAVSAVFRASADRGMDEPRNGVFKRTALGASFDAFDLDRYLLTEEGRALRAMAGQVPYDAIVILVNSARYGGGGIYNDYAITTVDHPASKSVFVHEFGHSFAGLGDEYYSSDVAYKDFYPKGIEPLEPNLTALLDPSSMKWKDLVTPGTPLPTPWGKDELDSLQEVRRRFGAERRTRLQEEKASGARDDVVQAISEQYRAKDKNLVREIEGVRARYAHLEDVVGAFEGAGYTSQGLYRPMVHCIMISSPKGEFCTVCQRAIGWMIGYFSGSPRP